jgi:hypothetical protein
MTTVLQLEEYVDSCSTQILKQFERLAETGPIDLGEWLQMYGNSCTPTLLTIAYDVVGELAFGRKFGFLEEGLPDFERSNLSEGYWMDEVVGTDHPFYDLDRGSSLYGPDNSTSMGSKNCA